MAIFTKPKLLFLILILVSLFLASQCDEEENNNPYLFKSHRFTPQLRSKHGEFRVLDKFTDELFGGIEKYRVGVLEFEPMSFMRPHHFDAQLLLLTVRGTYILLYIARGSN